MSKTQRSLLTLQIVSHFRITRKIWNSLGIFQEVLWLSHMVDLFLTFSKFSIQINRVVAQSCIPANSEQGLFLLFTTSSVFPLVVLLIFAILCGVRQKSQLISFLFL